MRQWGEAKLRTSMLSTLASQFPAGRAATGFRRLKGEEGSGLLENAIVLTLLMTMMLGIANFGGALYGYHFVSHVAREATRWAAVNGYTCNSGSAPTCNGQGGTNNGPASLTDIQNYVKNNTPMGIDISKLMTTVSWPTEPSSPQICTQEVNQDGPHANYPGCTVQVQVSYTSTLNFPFVNRSLTLSSTSAMVIVH